MSIALGVCYYPEHWPEDMWADDARAMIDKGISLVRIGEFAWSRLEPSEGQYEWDWLDRAIDTLSKAGLKIILGTPSATPPRWMIDKFPDMLAYDKTGRPRTFGSRRHYCMSHIGYRDYAAKMAGLMAERYGDNPHIHSWQIDNEYGCHETSLSYSPVARDAFQVWLKDKYGTTDALNSAWGNVFWSMEYDRFDQVELPNLTVTEANPAHCMDFYRFSTDQIAAFNLAQVKAMRAHTDAPLLHNYMGRITDFNHYKVGEDLDIATWDSYPMGFLEDRSDQNEDFRHAYQRQGDPDFQAFHHDLYRAVGKSRWAVMEQQPGPVNWAPYNPAPLPGMVRLWSWEAISHGAEFVSYFRWRQAPFGQEQFHSGLRRPDNIPAAAAGEVRQLSKELKAIDIPKTETAKIGLIFDYASEWAWTIQPQGAEFNYFRLVYDFYKGLRKHGVNIDILPPSQRDFSAYDIVIAPGVFTLPDDLKAALEQSEADVLFGPRTHSKTEHFSINTAGLSTTEGLDIKTILVETLRPTERVPLEHHGHVHIWREHIEYSGEIELSSKDGHPVLTRSGKHFYLSAWPDEEAMFFILERLLTDKGVPVEFLPKGVRVRSIGDLKVYINYAAETRKINGRALPPAAVHIINTETEDILIAQ